MEVSLTALAQNPPRLKTSACAACGHANDSAALFCVRCTAPLAVVALGDLSDADRRVCLSALLQMLADGLKNEPAPVPALHDGALWLAYLSAFWLRPETALILYAEALAIRSASTGSPWLDLGCGDGIHAALYSGWRFDPVFDAFQSLDISAPDIYHHWDEKDFAVSTTTRGPTVAHGIDIKSTAVDRAKALGIFASIRQSDATRLPIADKSIRTIFSNMLRDLGEPLPAALQECRRVLTDDGTLLISAMTPAYARHLHFAPAAREAQARGDEKNAQDLLRLDRGRSVFCQRQLSVEDWKRLLAEHGLQLKSVHPIVGPAAIRFWDIGLRPFSIALLKQRAVWKNAGVLGQVKSGMVDLMAQALEPLIRQLALGEPCMNLLSVGKA
jgi:SAM-dependent methyltransferase